MPFCLEDQGARSLGSYTGDLEARMRGPHACELRELDLARDMAHRLRTELIYGMPAEAQIYDERQPADVHGVRLRGAHRKGRSRSAVGVAGEPRLLTQRPRRRILGSPTSDLRSSTKF